MNHGTLAGNTHINARIHELLREIHASDVARFVRKFRGCSDKQCFHTFRELIPGAHLRRSGWDLRYERRFAGRTPDWVLVDDADHVLEIIDVVTLHQRADTDLEIARKASSPGGWTGWVTTDPDRLFSKVADKADVYASLSAEARVPYIVALFAEFTAPIEPREMSHVLYDRHGGVFTGRPNMAGVIFFRERFGQYVYNYFKNHESAVSSTIVGGRD